MQTGKCIVNSPAGVKALDFMVKLATKDKLFRMDTFLRTENRLSLSSLQVSGVCIYWSVADTEYNKVNPSWKIKYAQIPPFAGNKPAPLIVTRFYCSVQRRKEP